MQKLSRAYKFKHKANQSKIDNAFEYKNIIAPYYNQMINEYFLRWIKTGDYKYRINYKELSVYNEMIEKGFTAREIEYRGELTCGEMKSLISNFKNHFRDIITEELKGKIWDEEKSILYFINRTSCRKEGEYTRKDKSKIFISQNDIDWYRQMVYDFFTRGLLIHKTVKEDGKKVRRLAFKKSKLPTLGSILKFNLKLQLLTSHTILQKTTIENLIELIE